MSQLFNFPVHTVIIYGTIRLVYQVSIIQPVLQSEQLKQAVDSRITRVLACIVEPIECHESLIEENGEDAAMERIGKHVFCILYQLDELQGVDIVWTFVTKGLVAFEIFVHMAKSDYLDVFSLSEFLDYEPACITPPNR